MESMSRSTWLTVATIIAALIVVYGLFLSRQGAAALTGAVKCDAPKEVCRGGDCANHPECASGACNKNCPGNCNKQKPV